MNIIRTNIDKLVEGQREFIVGSYEQFLAFGGPCVYFHSECLAEGNRNFLSKRHIEEELQRHMVALPKLIDNSIVNYVRKVSGQIEDMA